MKRRFLSIALAACLVMGILPAASLAANTNEPEAARHVFAAGTHHFLAVKSDSSLWAWGANNFGQLGDGSINHRPTPVKIMDDVAAVYAIGRTSFAIKTNGDLYGWGNNTSGLLGSGSNEHIIKPHFITDDVISLTLTETHALAVKSDKSLWNWGADVGNRINGTSNLLYPSKIMDEVEQVAAVKDRTMALKTDGSLWGWGKDKGYGLVGDGGRTDRVTPVKIADDVKKVVVTEYMSMLLQENGEVWTWGLTNNYFGTKATYTAYPERLTDRVADIAGGSLEGVLIRANGDVFKHGFETETKDGVTYYKRYHTIEVTKNGETVNNGARHNAVILNDGTLWAWGDNENGQLGDGTTAKKDAAVKITGNVVELLCTDSSTMALKSDGSLWVWGFYGQNVDESGEGANITYPYKILSDILMPVVIEEPEPVDLKLDEASSWARDNITKASEKGLVPPSLIGNYKQNITRAEFCLQAVTFIEARSGMPIDEYLASKDMIVGLSPFSDTYDRAVIAAYRLKIVSGKSAGLFDPNGEITRQEAAVMLAKTAAELGYPTTAAENSFPDKSSIDIWALTSVNFVAARGVMSGTTSGFEPKGKFTREQADTTFLLMFNALN